MTSQVESVINALLQERLDDAEASLARACFEINALKHKLQEADTIARFWRNAAEHAIDGWNRLEDEHELLKDTLRALANAGEPASEIERPAMPDTVDLGDGLKLRVVEEESMLIRLTPKERP